LATKASVWNLSGTQIKAVINLRKHNISFQEATTVFNDSLSVTFPDPDHSVGENRYVMIGMSGSGNYLVVSIVTEKNALASSVLEEQLTRETGFMKKDVDELDDEPRPEYDFSKMARGIRGKYVERYRAGTNLVLLDPDIAQAFPTDASVNEALRLLF